MFAWPCAEERRFAEEANCVPLAANRADGHFHRHRSYRPICVGIFHPFANLATATCSPVHDAGNQHAGLPADPRAPLGGGVKAAHAINCSAFLGVIQGQRRKNCRLSSGGPVACRTGPPLARHALRPRSIIAGGVGPRKPGHLNGRLARPSRKGGRVAKR